jgi:hypothetical protein
MSSSRLPGEDSSGTVNIPVEPFSFDEKKKSWLQRPCGLIRQEEEHEAGSTKLGGNQRSPSEQRKMQKTKYIYTGLKGGLR